MCPLCEATAAPKSIAGPDHRHYRLCEVCRLITVDPADHLAADEERAHYECHRNTPEDPRYVAFLQPIVDRVLPLLTLPARALDYGAGPGPALSTMLAREGIACDDYDPFFCNRPLEPPYDLVCSTETFEHFRAPGAELARIRELLRPGGMLAVMTERWTTLDRFAQWYYPRDPTHIAFFHTATFDVVCTRFGFRRRDDDGHRIIVLERL